MTPDVRAELEEERDHLLRSLEDLERERAVGDVDEVDYAALKDSYTSRAAAVLRRLAAADADPTAPDLPAVAPGRRRSSAVVAAWIIGLVLFAVVAGVLVARSSGERRPGQVASGNPEADSVGDLLGEARALLAPNAPEASMQLYAQVLALEPDNVEALTYLGWLSALSARTIEDEADAADRFQTGMVLLRQATTVDETYADPHCFLGVLFFRFVGDVEAARPEFERCLELDPPAEAKGLVESALADLEAQVAASSTSAPDPSTAEG